MTNELVLNYDHTRQQIAEAQAVDEVLNIRAKMAALVKFFASKRDPEEERRARELQLLAEARIGEMSMALKNGYVAGTGRGHEGEKVSAQDGNLLGKCKTLKSAGISTQKASMYERLARLPKEELQEAARNGKSAKRVLKEKEMPFRRATSTELEERGFSTKSERHINPETGETISRTAVLKRKAAEEALASAEPKLSASDFPMSAQQKFDMWKRQQLKLIEETFEHRVRVECQKRLEETLLPYYNERHAEHERIVKNRKGMMTRQHYNMIRSCLHPDRVQDPNLKMRYEEAFRIFNDLEFLFLDEKERPTAASFKMPSTVGEMMAMRKSPARQTA